MAYEKMNPVVKKLWLKALRSGKFQQGRHQLTYTAEGDARYCCLGVLCEIAKEAQVITRFRSGNNYLPKAAATWAGIPAVSESTAVEALDTPQTILARKNDRGESFKDIATWIAKHLILLLTLGGSASAATIDYTAHVGAINVGQPTFVTQGVTTSTASGYLQATHLGGIGVCSPLGWSCNEVEYPEALRVDFGGPVRITAVEFGYLQPTSPWDGPGYLPVEEIAVVRQDNGLTNFYAGVDQAEGIRRVEMDLAIDRWVEVFGLGRQPGIWPALMATSVRAISWEPRVIPPPPPPPPNPTIPEPSIILLALTAAGVRWATRR